MKMPYLIGATEENSKRLKDVVDRILNDEVVVFANLEDLNSIQSLATSTPYIIDKLKDHSRTLESELMTVMGLDNNGNSSLEQTHVSIDAVNANNQVINEFHQGIEDEMNKFVAAINRVFGRNVKITPNIQKVKSVHEEVNINENINN